MSDFRTLRAALLVAALLPATLSAQDGQTLFTINCSACHLADRQLVGPSLVEVSKLYTGKLEEFVAWCNEPKQKREGVIEMPSMAHVGADNLKLIHAYILEASKGLKEVKIRDRDPFYASPSMRKRPNVLRLFMPEAGPAAIAVAVNDELHYCWDAGECRLRYIWKGDFVDGWPVWKGNGDGLAKVQGEVLLREEHSPLQLTSTTRPKFLGYRIRDGLPAFHYRIGELEVVEEIRPSADGKALDRSFTIVSDIRPVLLTFPPSKRVDYSSRHGTWEGDVLTVDRRLHRYTVTLTPKP